MEEEKKKINIIQSKDCICRLKLIFPCTFLVYVKTSNTHVYKEAAYY